MASWREMAQTPLGPEAVFALDEETLDRLGQVIASLCRWGNHDWSEAMGLPMHHLFWRFDSLQKLIQHEQAAAPSGPPGTKL